MADEVKWNADQVMARIRRGATIGAVRGAEAVLKRGNQKMLLEEKHGEEYVRRGVVHTASAPGEAPASDTGRLVQSAHVVPDKENCSCDAVWSTDYALKLELGDEHVEARPYALPSLEEGREFCERVIAEEIARALK